MERWARHKYQPSLPLYQNRRVTASEEHIALSQQMAEEGLVLLKNNNDVLPLRVKSQIALVGKGVFDYVKGGGGSGDVNTPYVRNLYDGIKEAGDFTVDEELANYYREYVTSQYEKGAQAGMMPEACVPEELLANAAKNTDTAILVFSRFSGEGWDRSSVEYEAEFNPWTSEVTLPQVAGKIFPKGDFYLTEEEETLLSATKNHFSKVIVLMNIGGIMDLRFIREDDAISAAILMGQGGMEGGLAVARTLSGKVNPSGHLPDTYARTLESYPSTDGFHQSPHYVEYTEDIFVGYRYFQTIPKAADEVVYPFGYGLSYTTFEWNVSAFHSTPEEYEIVVTVKNTGCHAGKDVVQLYADLPTGKLGKPSRILLGFAKTGFLLAGEEDEVSICFTDRELASFDPTGVICDHALIVEQGEYHLFLGHSILDVMAVPNPLCYEEDVLVEQLHAYCAPTSLPKVLLADGSYEELAISEPYDKDACVIQKMEPGTEEALCPATAPRDIYMMLDAFPKGAILLEDVADGKATIDDFLAQLSDDELIHLLGGQPNTGVGNTFGFGNLPKYGVPSVMTADGPAGVRIHGGTGISTTAWPCATTMASSFNTELLEAVGFAGGEELKENNLAVWLTPAVNIHRNPYCGRNFEYYSEDPLVAGKMGAALVRGIQKNGVGACVKHFACNNKETNRKHSDSRVSEKALREIYLRNFEIIVRESDPWMIMSSYNVINGVRASENKELLEGILREEWGFKGCVTTDWWTRAEHYKEILAGNDVKMATGFPERVKEAADLGAICREDYLHCAKRVMELILKMD